MNSSFDVLGVGAAIVDIVAQVPEGFLDDQALPKGAMTLMDSAQADAVYAAMGPGREVSGGSAANTIAGIAALGARAAFVGKTKDDQFGAVFAHDMRAIGAAFDTPPFASESDGATARSMILVTPDAQRTMCTDLGVSGLLSTDDLPIERIEATEILYLEGYLWDRDAAKDAFRTAMAAAKGADRRVALTLSDPFCVDRHRDSFRALVEGPVDILFANEAELLSLYQTDDLGDAARQVGAVCPLVAVTRGPNGVIVIAAEEHIAVEAAPIDQLVDTTGAGDSFAAGFLYGLTTGQTPKIAGQMGCVAAADIIQHVGARSPTDLRAAFRAAGLPLAG